MGEQDAEEDEENDQDDQNYYHQCDDCGKRFETFKALITHEETECGNEINIVQDTEELIEDEENDQYDQNYYHQCDDCGKSFETFKAPITHEETECGNEINIEQDEEELIE